METNIKIYHVSRPQSKLHMEGFRSLKEGEAVEFTFKKSAKGLESIRVTGPGGVFCIGSERRPKGKNMQKRRSKGDRYGREGGWTRESSPDLALLGPGCQRHNEACSPWQRVGVWRFCLRVWEMRKGL